MSMRPDVSLDAAQKMFEENPTNENAETWLSTAKEYFGDGMIGEEEYEVIRKQVEDFQAPLKLFSIDVSIIGTAYIKAKTEEEAHDLIEKELVDQTVEATEDEPGDGEFITGREFQDPKLPTVSLSPAMSIKGVVAGAELEIVDDDVPPAPAPAPAPKLRVFRVPMKGIERVFFQRDFIVMAHDEEEAKKHAVTVTHVLDEGEDQTYAPDGVEELEFDPDRNEIEDVSEEWDDVLKE